MRSTLGKGPDARKAMLGGLSRAARCFARLRLAAGGPGNDLDLRAESRGHRDDRPQLRVPRSGQQSAYRCGVLVDGASEIGLRHAVLLTKRIKPVDDRIYSEDLALLALELGPELRVLLEPPSKSPVVIAGVLLGLSLVGRNRHGSSSGRYCSTYGTQCST